MQIQCPLQPFPELVMEQNHTCLLVTPLLLPIIIRLAEMLTLLRKNLLLIFQDSAQREHTIVENSKLFAYLFVNFYIILTEMVLNTPALPISSESEVSISLLAMLDPLHSITNQELKIWASNYAQA